MCGSRRRKTLHRGLPVCGGGGGAPIGYLAQHPLFEQLPNLRRDFSVPPLFDRSPRWLAENAVLGCAAVDMKWLYLGQVCSRPLLPCSPVNVAAPPATGRHGLSDARRHEHDFGGAAGWKSAVCPA